VMDGSSPEIEIDENGICNFCHQALRSLEEVRKEQPNLSKVLSNVFGEPYVKDNCIMGLSGGPDSSTALHYAVKLGLNPVCFSLDNGWNDPRADKNVEKLVKKTGVKFFKMKVDAIKFLELQGAFLRAGVSNIEIPTDHILMATTLQLASELGKKWIISGGNVATESIMPSSWSYNARDLTHIKDIYKKMTGKKLTGLPLCSLAKWNYYRWIKGIKTLYLLDYLGYNKKYSIELLQKEYDYELCGEKHEENVFTKWFQNFYLFEKFGIDKRKAHYSSLINSDQMTREEAIELLKKPPVYPEIGLEKKAMEYPKREHSEFKQDKMYNLIAKILR
jgi:hypothetical protein